MKKNNEQQLEQSLSESKKVKTYLYYVFAFLLAVAIVALGMCSWQSSEIRPLQLNQRPNSDLRQPDTQSSTLPKP